MEERDEFLDFVEELNLRGLEGFPLDDSEDYDDDDGQEIIIQTGKKQKFIMPELDLDFLNFAS